MRYSLRARRGAALWVGIIAAGGCRDAGLAPEGERVGGRDYTPGAQVAINSGVLGGGTVSGMAVTTARITVSPTTTATFIINGTHKLVIPAGAICDPKRSTYGPTEWDKACTPISSSITITATGSSDAAGHPRIDFSPALRFVRTSQASKMVMLYMKDARAAANPSYRILWCGRTGRCIDESRTDASVVTRRNTRTGTVYRRIKHFSGYNISVGRS